MQKYFRTDLAYESANRLGEIEGTEHSSKDDCFCRIERLSILTDEASEKLSRPIGKYTTIFTPKLWQLWDAEVESISESLARELLSLILSSCKIKKISQSFSVLAVGLGNSSITADAIGPDTIDRLTVTRHIKAYNKEIFDDIGYCEISAIVPGVLGKTGIESFEIIKSAANEVNPNLIIAIDALAAADVERLASTVQLSDTGINPGAGIGNLRAEISKKTLGVPVISLGIPTVADSSTIILDAFSKANIEEIPDSMHKHLESGVGYYVTPKESDLITEKAAILLSRAISDALVIS